MNYEEAKLILQAYRPSGQDISDPLVAEALERARRNPELKKWFAEGQAVDLRVQAKLRTAVVVPPELKANLLSLEKISRAESRLRRPLWLAVAAAVILLLALSAFWLRPQDPAQLAAFREKMVHYSMEEREHVTFESSDIAKIQEWLQSHGIKTDFDLPGGLHGKYAEGCRVVDWNGQKATMICFVLPGHQHVDFFVMDRAGLPELSENSGLRFAQIDSVKTMAWAKGNRVCLLTGNADKKFLLKLLQES